MRHIKLVLSENEFDTLVNAKVRAEKKQKKLMSWERFIFQKITRRCTANGI